MSASPNPTPSRRAFIGGSLSLGALAALPRAAAAAAPAATSAATTPGVLFDAADLPRIRATLARPEFAPLYDADRAADLSDDHRFLTEELDLFNLVSHLSRAANIAQRSAFIHRIEPHAGHRDLACLALATVLKFDRWDWILEDGEHTVGVMRGPSVAVLVICAQDWLGDDLDAAVHTAIFERLATEAGPASYRAVSAELGERPFPAWSMNPTTTGLTRVDVSRWPEVLADTNLQIIATAGLMAVACRLPHLPESAAWRELALRSLRAYDATLPPDRSFPEGSAYWSFTYTYFFLALDFLRRSGGADERTLSDFPAMSRYMLAMSMPTNGQPRDCISIGDCNVNGSIVPLAWIARHFRDTTAQFQVTRPGLLNPTDIYAWGAIWFDPSVPARIAADLTLDRISAPGVVVSRSGWSKTDSVLSFRSGGPCNHEHADRNSLLFSAFGERLLNDPLRASYSTHDPKWLLRQTAAHSAVLINGRGHVYHDGSEGTNASLASATLRNHQVGLDWMTATSDATDAYRRAELPVTYVGRTIVFVKPGLLICLDAIDLTTAQPVQLRFQVYNDDSLGHVVNDANGFVISRPHADLTGHVIATPAATLGTGQLELPAAVGRYPFAAVNSPAATRHRLLTVCQAHPRDEAASDLTATHAEGRWAITGAYAGKPLNLTITESSAGRAPSVAFD